MSCLTCALVFGLAGLALGPVAAFAGADAAMAEKDKTIGLSAQTRTLPFRPTAELKALRYDAPSRGVSLPLPIREPLAQEKAQVIPNRATMQLGDKNELHYRYAAGSSFTLSARSHRFSFGWRTRF